MTWEIIYTLLKVDWDISDNLLNSVFQFLYRLKFGLVDLSLWSQFVSIMGAIAYIISETLHNL